MKIVTIAIIGKEKNPCCLSLALDRLPKMEISFLTFFKLSQVNSYQFHFSKFYFI